jgi:hypothetical protein
MRPTRFAEWTTEEIWAVDPGGKRSVGARQLTILALLIVVGALVGAFGTISFPLEFGVNTFWIGIAVQQVGAIWFGMWGVLAGVIFPFFSNATLHTAWYISAAYIPANFIQSLLPAWAFRHFHADPRLRRGRDFVILLVAMLVSNALGALWSVMVVLNGLGLLPPGSTLLYIWGWFGGNLLAGIVFNFLSLFAFSGMVLRAGVFVKRWWS